MITPITQHPTTIRAMESLPAHPEIEQAAQAYEASFHRLQEDEQRRDQVAARLQEIAQQLASGSHGDLRNQLRSQRTALQLEQTTIPEDIAISRGAMIKAFESWRLAAGPVVKQAIEDAIETIHQTGYEFHFKQNWLRKIPQGTKKYRVYAERVQELKDLREPLIEQRDALRRCQQAITWERSRIMTRVAPVLDASIPLEDLVFNVTWIHEGEEGARDVSTKTGTYFD